MKNILITGASGFLGQYIVQAFRAEDVFLTSIGRSSVPDADHHVFCDLSASGELLLPEKPFEKVVHVAGKAHVFPKTEAEKAAFFAVNLQGTQNLLNALDRLAPPKMFVHISTVAVYGKQAGELISEDSAPVPDSPYGQSKLQAEQAVAEWAQNRGCQYLNLRLPLVAGANPPGNLGDMKQAIARGAYPRIKHNQARKSIVNATDVARFIVRVAEGTGAYNLTDGIHPTFEQIEDAIQQRLNKKIRLSLAYGVVKKMALFGDLLESLFKKDMPISSQRLEKLTSTLTFDDTRARTELGWTSDSALRYLASNIYPYHDGATPNQKPVCEPPHRENLSAARYP